MTDVVFEPLGVADKDFHIAKSIDQCPPRLMMRELLQNAFEAPLLPEEEGVRYVAIRVSDVNSVPKLTIWNGGQGMTADELVQATDLASSIRKPMGLDGRKNRGEGAKVASLPWNRNGFRIRSCHGGRVSEVMLRRTGDMYVRERERVRTTAEDGTEQFDSVWDVTDDVKGQPKDYDLARDWTEVTLLGMRQPSRPRFGLMASDKGAATSALPLLRCSTDFMTSPRLCVCLPLMPSTVAKA